jgi:hypothetical protein
MSLTSLAASASRSNSYHQRVHQHHASGCYALSQLVIAYHKPDLIILSVTGQKVCTELAHLGFQRRYTPRALGRAFLRALHVLVGVEKNTSIHKKHRSRSFPRVNVWKRFWVASRGIRNISHCSMPLPCCRLDARWTTPAASWPGATANGTCVNQHVKLRNGSVLPPRVGLHSNDGPCQQLYLLRLRYFKLGSRTFVTILCGCPS